MAKSTWGERLRAYRLGKGIKQGEAARQIGVRHATLCEVELGKKRPSVRTQLLVERWSLGKIKAQTSDQIIAGRAA